MSQANAADPGNFPRQLSNSSFDRATNATLAPF